MRRLAKCMVWGVCISVVMISRVGAQQGPLGNSQIEQFRQLSQEAQALRQQLEQLRSQKMQAAEHIKALDNQISNIELKLSIDAQRVQILMKKHA